MRATEQNNRSSRKGWKWLVVGFLCLALFLLRHNIAGLIVNTVLRKSFNSEHGATFAYGSVHWEGRTISIDELDIETLDYRLAVQRIEIVLEFSFSPFDLSPHVWIVRPYVIFQGNGVPSSSPSTLAAPFALINWIRLDIVEGRFEWLPRQDAVPEEIFLQFVSGTTPHSVGTLELFAKPEMTHDPLIRMAFDKQSGKKNGLFVHWESQKLATHHLLPLLWMTCGYAVTGWERIEGAWELNGNLALDEKGAILDLQNSLAITNLELRNIELGLHVAAHKVSLNLQQRLPDAIPSSQSIPWYQKIEAHALIEEGEMECTQPFAEHPWGITHLDGRMSWCEKEDPVFALRGVTIQQDGEKELFVHGTGSLGNDHSFWLQTYLTWGAEEKPLLETTVSLCSPEPRSVVIEAQVSELQMSAVFSLGALFGIPQEYIESFHFNEGALKGVATAWVENENLDRIELRDFSYEKLNFVWDKSGQFHDLSGTLEGSWRRNPSGWSNNHFMTSFRLAEFHSNHTQNYGRVTEIEGEYAAEGSRIVRAMGRGKLGELPFVCTCEGSLNAYQFVLSSDTNLSTCLRTFSPAAIYHEEAGKKIGVQLHFEGKPHFDEISYIKGNVLIKAGDATGKEISLESFWPIENGVLQPKGKIYGGSLPAALVLPFLQKNYPEAQCVGDFDLEGTFDEKGIELLFEIPQLQVTTSSFGAEILPIKDKSTKGRFTSTWATNESQFLLPLADARVTLPAFNLQISHICGLLEADKNQVVLKDLLANCEGIALHGQVHVNKEGIALRTDKIRGRFEDLESVCSKATRRQYQVIGMSGEFSSGADGLFFEAPLDFHQLKTLAFQTAFSSFRIPLHKDGACEEITGAIAYDSRQNIVKLGETHGIFTTTGAQFAWGFRPAIFTKKDDQWEGTFDANLTQNQLELLRIVSLLRLSNNSFAFAIDPKYTHLLGSSIEKGKGILTPDFSKFQCQMTADLEQIPAFRELICDMTLVKEKDLPQSEFLEQSSSGLIKMGLEYDSTVSLLQFSLQGKQLQLFGIQCPELFCQGKKMEQEWKFTDFRWGDHRVQFDLSVRNFELVIPSFSGTIAGLGCRGSATCSLPKSQWQFQLQSLEIPLNSLANQSGVKSSLAKKEGGDSQTLFALQEPFLREGVQTISNTSYEDLKTPIANITRGKAVVNFQTKQPFLVDYSDKEHCMIKNVVLEDRDSQSLLACPHLQIDWQDKSFRAADIKPRFTAKFMQRLVPITLEKIAIAPKDPLEGTFQVEGNWRENLSLQAQGIWKECLFQYGEKQFLVQQIHTRLRDKKLLFGGKITLGQLPAITSLQIDWEKEVLGVFKLQENQETDLSVFFRVLKNGAFELSHIKGEFSGIKPQLKKKGPQGVAHLQGLIDIDFTKMRQLFARDAATPWQNLQLGKGFTLEGDFLFQQDNIKFQGELRGAQCELLGCHLQGLSTNLTYEPQRLKFEKFQILDPALTLTMRRLIVEETAADKIWTLACPTLQIREFQPSRLRKVGKQPSPEKPFVIRNFTLLNLMGDLNNPKSFSGECSLHFTNAEKKETSLFDLPLDFVKDLGLDPSLLVPIQGELDGHFENGRLLFTSLKGSYSEGRRTQFMLADHGDGSYIDFQGNLHIDLAIRQAVLLKIAESLTLGIRGSVEKPRYVILR